MRSILTAVKHGKFSGGSFTQLRIWQRREFRVYGRGPLHTLGMS
jgi:hypothetical protein